MRQLTTRVVTKLIGVATIAYFSVCNVSAQETNKAPINKYRIKSTYSLDPARLKEISAMLPEQPKGMGEPASNRSAWDKLLNSGKFDRLIADADAAILSPLPELTHEIYMSFFNSNDSETSKMLVRKRIVVFGAMVWAECLKNDGKYMPGIEAALVDLINQKSWNFPAEDRKLTNYNGTLYTIHLSASCYAHDIAEALYLLGDKIKPELRKKAMEALYTKVLTPAITGHDTGNEQFVSLTNTDGNHNTVTIAGVTGAALAVIPDKNERAKYVAIAERYIKNTLAGFLDDGYCTEGLGYYNYGFKHYILLRETLLQATNNKIDLFNDPKIDKIAHYVPNIEIMNNVFPTIGDCKMNEKPIKFMMYYLNRTLNLGLKNYGAYTFDDNFNPPLQNIYMAFPTAATYSNPSGDKSHKTGIRSYFDKAGVITVRPEEGSSCKLGVTFKGGHNQELHNHNDLGSYTLVADKELLSGDPGLATYTSKTFTAKRYTIKTIASYGHPVPLVAGKEQSTGAQSKAIILKNDFTDKEDQVVMDIASAYAVPELKKLCRSFTYNRENDGYLTVGDEVEFTESKDYETVIITRAKWKQIGKNQIELQGIKEKLIVSIQSSSAYTIVSETITEAPKPYTRLAIRLNEPVKYAKISVTYKRVN
ncbi:heparinase II/III family protein [Pedobacter arcticus]|uniref:heparinase II/III family protein n=1 Tax=Pedobacter arcticus TaxID=752140 RepID=UPI00036A7CED|nr:heparinase II/III family protein [Pedobacter arcticus]